MISGASGSVHGTLPMYDTMNALESHVIHARSCVLN